MCTESCRGTGAQSERRVEKSAGRPLSARAAGSRQRPLPCAESQRVLAKQMQPYDVRSNISLIAAALLVLPSRAVSLPLFPGAQPSGRRGQSSTAAFGLCTPRSCRDTRGTHEHCTALDTLLCNAGRLTLRHLCSTVPPPSSVTAAAPLPTPNKHKLHARRTHGCGDACEERRT